VCVLPPFWKKKRNFQDLLCDWGFRIICFHLARVSNLFSYFLAIASVRLISYWEYCEKIRLNIYCSYKSIYICTYCSYFSVDTYVTRNYYPYTTKSTFVYPFVSLLNDRSTNNTKHLLCNICVVIEIIIFKLPLANHCVLSFTNQWLSSFANHCVISFTNNHYHPLPTTISNQLMKYPSATNDYGPLLTTVYYPSSINDYHTLLTSVLSVCNPWLSSILCVLSLTNQ
jgi:hypothetical protein